MRLTVRSCRTVLCVLAVLLSGLAPAWVRAADPQAYKVDFEGTGDDELDATLRATSQLEALRASAPVDAYGLIARARGDLKRLKTVLDSFGYYQGTVSITVDGRALAEPDLADSVSALPAGSEAHLRIAFSLGPLYHVGRIRLEGEVPEAQREALGLESGAPAVASEVLAAGARLQSALQEVGFAFARVDPPVAWEDPQGHILDLDYKVSTGPRVRVGEISLRGLKRVHESFVRKRLLLQSGQEFNSADVEKARRDLLGLGVFAAVSVQLGKSPDALGHVPVTFEVRERLRHAIGVNAAYSSDLGGSGGVTWSDRNVFGNGEQLTLAASAINIGGRATTALGYDTSARYLIPEFRRRDQSLQFSFSGLRQALQAYDQRAETAGVSLNRRLSGVWSASAGITAGRESIVQETGADIVRAGKVEPVKASYDYTLLALPLSLLYDSTDLATPLEDPTHGVRGALNFAPTLSIGRPNSLFLITQATVSGYLDLEHLVHTSPGRCVLALRALGGVAQGASTFQLPPDERFYAGGSGTIRGYRYQSVGPLFRDSGNPIGGVTLSALNIEYRQRIGRSLGFAVFADGGAASAKLQPLSGTIEFGVGAGLRYYTPIGPVRVDLAFPTRRRTLDGFVVAGQRVGPRTVDDRFEIYIGLGQAF